MKIYYRRLLIPLAMVIFLLLFPLFMLVFFLTSEDDYDKILEKTGLTAFTDWLTEGME